jgi:RNA polymerase sigma-70 factor, ECF subfamily
VPGVDDLTRLALAAGAGDAAALDRLVEGAYDQVWRFCARLVDQQTADDLAQDAFMRAVGALPQFRGQSSARTWLLSIARNTCMDELRARDRRRRRDATLAAGRTDAGVVCDVSSGVGASDLVARLAPERREAFVLTQLLGLSYAESAEICGCPPGTIRSRVSRARADLLRALAAGALPEAVGPVDGAYSSDTSMYPMTRDMTS